MFAIYKLILRTNIKSPSIAFPLVMPFMFMLILSPGFTNSELSTAGIISLLAVGTMQAGLMGFGFTFISLKKSILLRRIGATQITKTQVLSGIGLYGLSLWAVQLIWTFTWAFLFGLFMFEPMNWGSIHLGVLILSLFLGAFVSFPLGMLFATISKDDLQFGIYQMFYFFFASFFGGMLIPNVNIEWMRYVGYCIPSVYNSHMFTAVGNGINITQIFDFSNGYYLPSLGGLHIHGWEVALNFFIPIVSGVTFIGLSIKLLKWD